MRSLMFTMSKCDRHNEPNLCVSVGILAWNEEEAVEAAKEEVAEQVAQVAQLAASLDPEPRTLNPITSDNLAAAPHHTHIIEKIVERIVERPLRRRLPDTRHATTHKTNVAAMQRCDERFPVQRPLGRAEPEREPPMCVHDVEACCTRAYFFCSAADHGE